MGRTRKSREADVILGAFSSSPAATEESSQDPAEVIDFAPFLAARRERSAAPVAPSADPA